MSNLVLDTSGAARSIASSSTAAQRLEVFSAAQIADVSRQLGPIGSASWPRIEGCLAILFTSRSGSTCLARGLERLFAIGRLRESLNPSRVRRTPAAQIVQDRRDPWFSFKAGPDGVIGAELCGFFDVYLPRTSLILLRRRDVIAQAISCVKANQTGRWHSVQKATAPSVYDGARIAQYISLIVAGVDRLHRYAELTKRPWTPLTYEDFAEGDLTGAVKACDTLGVPRRAAGAPIRPRPVARIGDATNAAWAARFRNEMDTATRDQVERYAALF